LHRYEKWLRSLLVEDRDLFFHIENWHQQQEIIRLQQDQLSANQLQARLMQRANQIAKEQLDSSRRQADIANQESHNEAIRIENAINKIRRELE